MERFIGINNIMFPYIDNFCGTRMNYIYKSVEFDTLLKETFDEKIMNGLYTTEYITKVMDLFEKCKYRLTDLDKVYIGNF